MALDPSKSVGAKPANPKEAVQIKPTPAGNFYYCWAEKASSSGLMANMRFLLIDTYRNTFGYSNDAPPVDTIGPGDNMKPPKKFSMVATTEYNKVVGKKNSVEFSVQVIDPKDKAKKPIKEKWLFTFKNNEMVYDWLKALDDAKKPRMMSVVPTPGKPEDTTYTPPIFANQVLTHSMSLTNPNNPPQALPIDSKGPNPATQNSAIRSSTIVRPNNTDGSNIKPPQPALEQPMNTSINKMTSSKITPPPGPNPVVSDFSQNGTRVNPPPQQQSSIKSTGQDWNKKFWASPTIEVLMDFQRNAENVVKGLIDDLSLPTGSRKNQTIRQSDGLEVYQTNGLEIKMVFLTKDSDEWREVNNQFRNYDYIINATKNKLALRVPLACKVDYKGIVCLTKAIVYNSEIVSPRSVDEHLNKLEQETKIKKSVFDIENAAKLKKVVYRPGDASGQVIYIDQLVHFIPPDVYAEKEGSQLRPETVSLSDVPLHTNVNIQTAPRNNSAQAAMKDLQIIAQTVRGYAQEFVGFLDNLDITILHTRQLSNQAHINGVNLRLLGDIYKTASTSLVKRTLATEMVSRVSRMLARTQLQEDIRNLSLDKSSVRGGNVDSMLVSRIYDFVNDLMSNNERSDRLWRAVNQQLKNKYKVTVSKQEMLPGYLLSSLIDKLGLRVNIPALSKDKHFFKASNTIRRDFVQGFSAKCRSYTIKFLPSIVAVDNILNATPNEEGKVNIINLLQLRNSGINPFYENCGLGNRIRIYLANFFSPTDQAELRSTDLYKYISQEPPTRHSIKLAFMAAKWAVSKDDLPTANRIFQESSELVRFWGAECHPLHSDFYDYFASYYNSIGDNEQAVAFSKCSIVNMVKVAGANSLPTAEKQYLLGNIHFKNGNKKDALQNYEKTQSILRQNQATDTEDYGGLGLKLALLHLNAGRNKDSLENAHESLKVFEKMQDNDVHLLETFQIMSRVYQINDQRSDGANIASMCSKKLNNTQIPSVLERMLKICVSSTLKTLQQTQIRIIIQMIEAMKIKKTPEKYEEAAKYLMRRAQAQNLAGSFSAKVSKFDRLNPEIKQKDLVNRINSANYTSYDAKTEAQDLTVFLVALTNLLGQPYLLGTLTDRHR